VLTRARDGLIAGDALDARRPEDHQLLVSALARLRERGLVAGDSGIPPEGTRLTPGGVEIYGELAEARRARLSELVADWKPEDPEVDQMVAELARELGEREPMPAS
jgi:hypothetical protein